MKIKNLITVRQVKPMLLLPSLKIYLVPSLDGLEAINCSKYVDQRRKIRIGRQTFVFSRCLIRQDDTMRSFNTDSIDMFETGRLFTYTILYEPGF